MTRDEMKAILQRLAGIAPWSRIPDELLDDIIKDIREAAKTQRITRPIIEEIVGQYVPDVGRYKTAGEDFSDINALLMAIQNPRPSAVTTPRPGGGSPPQSGGRSGSRK
jgi:hypothetical protein